MLGKGQYTEGELQKLYASDSSGPLAFLTASTLLRFTSVDASRLYAARGLEKLALDDFRKDYRLLLDDNSTAGRTVVRMAPDFRAMSDQEVEQLAKFYSVADSIYFRAAVRTLRSDRKKPLKEALADFIDACWKAGLQQRVKDALDALSRDEKWPTEVL